MPVSKYKSVRDVLLTQRGLAFVTAAGQPADAEKVCAVELELAEVGYVVSERLRRRFGTCSSTELADFLGWALSALTEHVGGDQKHEPLFRHFPQGVPDNTKELWWNKVLVHFLQAEGQPCLFCGRSGTTHVLNPCRHVVCDHCFDSSNYSACPSCEHHVDRASPFFQPAQDRGRPLENVRFKVVDLAESEEHEAAKLFVSLCERRQALSPVDRESLLVILREYKSRVLDWLPATIPVRENVAIVFGTLFQECNSDHVLPVARRFMTTATDVLRFIAVASGTDGSLLRETRFMTVERTEAPSRFWGDIAKLIGARAPGPMRRAVTIPLRVCRFKVAKLPRPLRRAVLSLLDGMHRDRLIEDMLRHRSYWVWVGEFLHPHEYAARFPNIAAAFQIVRKKAPDGTTAPRFRGWYSKLAQSFDGRDIDAMLAILDERPGEFARRIDYAIRVAGDDSRAIDRVVESFVQKVPTLATPVLLTLRSHLPNRVTPARVRIYWPKGRIAKGASSTDERPPLPLSAIEPVCRTIDAELLHRFAQKPAFSVCVIDDELRDVTVPFNERTASAAAVSLPRGSRVRVPLEKTMRLFLHWCQPAQGGQPTDLDLSVALYDDAWQYIGVCSYYQLKLKANDNQVIAQSAGDLRDGPWPEGATEFVDLHCGPAADNGARFAVMVVNNYAGMPFSRLERGFAGLMIRDDACGTHFDPRTVELKFAVNGENGVFLPFVLDLRDRVLHWLDVQSKGQFELNNVETSSAAITKICPELISYFESGVRPAIYDLALLHAAARCERIMVRGADVQYFTRRSGEDRVAFHQRLVAGESDGNWSPPWAANPAPILAFLYRGDLDLPEKSSSYALFRERVVPTTSASDLLS